MTVPLTKAAILTTALSTVAAPVALAQTAGATAEMPSSNAALLFAQTEGDTETVPMPQDPDATIDKAKPVEEMLGDTAPNGTTLDVDVDSATVDGVPRDAENSFVNTQSEEAEVGIPDSE